MADQLSPDNLRLNTWTLRYQDPALEAEYERSTPKALIRTIQPMSVFLIPVVSLLGISEYSGLLDVPFSWLTSLTSVLLMALMLLSCRYAPEWIEYSIVATYLVVMAMLCSEIDDQSEFARSLAGLAVLTLISSFVGTRYLLGVFTSIALIVIVTAFTLWRGYPVSLLVDVAVFLIVGLTVAYSTSYTIDRQRRRLFAQVKLLAQERDNQERLALHDALTGLPNRILLRERMTQSLARAQRQQEQFAVLFVDLDDFKTVNDSYGHGVGDDVLRQLASNLTERVRGEDTVARVGGDEFVVLSEHISDDAAAHIAADRIQAAVSQPVNAQTARDDTIHVHVTCSIGIALCPRDGDTLDALIERADNAMYNAKRGGKGTAEVFQPAATEAATDDAPPTDASR